MDSLNLSAHLAHFIIVFLQKERGEEKRIGEIGGEKRKTEGMRRCGEE